MKLFDVAMILLLGFWILMFASDIQDIAINDKITWFGYDLNEWSFIMLSADILFVLYFASRTRSILKV